MSGQPVNAISAETGTNAAQSVFVYIGFLSYGVDGRKIILHTLTCIVATNGLQPLHTVSGQSAAIGCHHNIAIGRHYLEIPTVTPELADSRLRSSLAVKQGGILLGRVKMGRINHPNLLLLAVCRSNPTFLDLAESEMLVEIGILGRETNAFFALTGRYQKEVVGFAHALTFGQERLAVGCDRKERVIVASLGKALHFSLQIGGINHGCSMPYTREI